MARHVTVGVDVIGDSASVERAFARTAAAGKNMNRSLTSSFSMSTANALKANTAFSKINLKGMFAGAAGGAGFFAASEGVSVLVDGLKQGVAEAASLEKSGEAIDALFGKSAGGVKKFANEAANIGISAADSEALSVRLGILSQNLGIGQAKAAEMAVGLQKLAGSIAEIRGIDPSTVLANLPQALAGNLRSLKQLGFAFSQAQIKQEALTEGLIRGKQALTPAAKAQAIFALVTKNLAGYEDQAAQHSGDLANQQHKLRAETHNLEANLGKLVTGPLTDFVTELGQAADGAAQLVGKMKELGGIKIPGFGGGKLGAAFKFSEKLNPFLNPLFLKDAFDAAHGGKGKPKPAGKLDRSSNVFSRIFGQQDPRDGRVIGGTPPRPGAPAKQLSVALQNREADARLSGSSKALKNVLQQEAAFLKTALESKRLKPKDKLGLKEALLSVVSEIDSINQGLKDAATSAKQAADSAAKQAADARKSAREAAAAQLKAKAQSLITSALDRLMGEQSRVQADRQLSDAQAALKVAKQIGGPEGIKQARRDLQDATLNEQITKLDQAKVRAEGKGSFVVSIGTVELHGIQNPKQLLAELQRLSRTGSPQSRGLRPGQHLGHA